MKKLRIREVKLKDAPKFAKMVNSFVKEDIPLTGLEKLTEQEAKNILKGIVGNKNIIYLVIDSEKELIGYARIDKGAYSNRSRHIGLLGIGIRKKYRDYGYGYTLAEEILKEAKKDPDLKIIEAYVFSINKRGIRFFENLGFKREAVLKKRIKYKNKLIDDIVMALELR